MADSFFSSARLLRTNILQPIADLDTINTRLDAVEGWPSFLLPSLLKSSIPFDSTLELIQNEEIFFDLKAGKVTNISFLFLQNPL